MSKNMDNLGKAMKAFIMAGETRMPMVQVDMFDGTQIAVAAISPQANLEERVRVLEVRLDAIVAAQYAAAVKPDHDPWIGDIVDSLPVACFEQTSASVMAATEYSRTSSPARRCWSAVAGSEVAQPERSTIS